jgi:hypothetical protein
VHDLTREEGLDESHEFRDELDGGLEFALRNEIMEQPERRKMERRNNRREVDDAAQPYQIPYPLLIGRASSRLIGRLVWIICAAQDSTVRHRDGILGRDSYGRVGVAAAAQAQ